MFIGHFGIGMGAKKAAPEISLGWLFLAVQFLDLLWPTLLLLNVEQVAINTEPGRTIPLTFTYYPFSHSLLMVLVWSFLFGLIYWLLKKNIQNAVILGLCVFSHWLLDLVVHYPDLPLFPGNSPLVGLGLWKSPAGTALIEGAIFITGLLWYVQSTEAKNSKGKFGLCLLVALLVITHLASLFGPAPTNVTAVAWGAQLMWILVFLAFRVDHNRIHKSMENNYAIG